MMRLLAGAVVLLLLPGMAAAGDADVTDVQIRKAMDGTFALDVSVVHSDESWEHYADRWEVLAPDGSLLGTRTLIHPHIGEQPVVRNRGGIEIPFEVQSVTIRAHDTLHGFTGVELTVKVPH